VTTQKKEEDVWEDLRGGGDQVVLDGTLRVLAEEYLAGCSSLISVAHAQMTPRLQE
jgi:hypothetical protein